MDIKEQYEGLTAKMKEHLPFKAIPSRELVQELRRKGNPITLKTVLEISSVYNSGDITGIVCAAEHGKEVLACALTHLTVLQRHPLHKEILAYQKKRIKRVEKLKRFGG